MKFFGFNLQEKDYAEFLLLSFSTACLLLAASFIVSHFPIWNSSLYSFWKSNFGNCLSSRLLRTVLQFLPPYQSWKPNKSSAVVKFKNKAVLSFSTNPKCSKKKVTLFCFKEQTAIVSFQQKQAAVRSLVTITEYKRNLLSKFNTKVEYWEGLYNLTKIRTNVRSWNVLDTSQITVPWTEKLSK